MKLSIKNKIIKKWIENNGCAGFDLKNRDIILYDGGLFYIENTDKIKEWTKVIKRKAEKRMFNGKEQIVYPIEFVPKKYRGKVNPNKIFNFIKKKIDREENFEDEVLHFFNKSKMDDMKAIIWFEELNETINYLIRMKKMLNKLGYKTNTSLK